VLIFAARLDLDNPECNDGDFRQTRLVLKADNDTGTDWEL